MFLSNWYWKEAAQQKKKNLRTALEAFAKEFYFSSEELDDYRKIRK